MIKGFGGFKRKAAEEPVQAPVATAVDAEREALALLRDFESSGMGWFWATDALCNISYISDCAAAMIGRPASEIIGQPFASLFHLDRSEEREVGRTLPLLLTARSKTFTDYTLAVRSERGDLWWSISGRPQLDAEGNFHGFKGNGADVTAGLREREDASRLAEYDSLTGLSNRHRMIKRLDNTLRAYKSTGRSCALMMLDLDRFKQVNDTLGHPAGDELLRQVAQRLNNVIDKSCEIGRLGGDEFQIVLPDHDDRGKLGDLAKKVIQIISQPYSIDGARCVIGASIGVAVAPFDGADREELVRNADMALYAAKAAGRGQFRFYTSELLAAADQRRRLEEDLREALARDEIRLHFQPIVRTTTNQVVGLEALMRWEHPDYGELPPALFIPIAEESNLIVELGTWAIHKACEEAAQWPGGISVAVNIAPAQFASASFMASVSDALADASLSPQRLELEFTERIFGISEDVMREQFTELKHLGIRLALDNFGSGLAPLAYLRETYFDKIKIDRTIIQEITQPASRSAAIAAAIATLAKQLGMLTTAEGIEARDELELMRKLEIDQIQGFIYAPPCTGEDVHDALATGQWVIEPEGPSRQRAERRTVLRKVGVIHEDFRYEVTMRNLSRGGAAIEGLLDVPIGTQFVLDLGEGQLAVSTVRRAEGALLGLEFETSLVDDGAGGLVTRHRVPRHVLEAMGMPKGSGGSGVTALNTSGVNLPKFGTAEPSRPSKAA